MQRFVQIKRHGGAYSYVPESDIAEISFDTKRAKLRSGDWVGIDEETGNRLISWDGLLRGVDCATGNLVSVPLEAIDNITDFKEEGRNNWNATATTRLGLKFYVTYNSRAALDLDDDALFNGAHEFIDKVRPREDREAEEAVDEAEAMPVRRSA